MKFSSSFLSSPLSLSLLFIHYFYLSVPKDHFCQEANKKVTEPGVDTETTEFGTATSDQQQCQRESCSVESKAHGKLLCH